MISRKTRRIESRLFWIGAGLVVAGSLVTATLFGSNSGASFFTGGVLAGLNLLWLRRTVSAAFDGPKRAKPLALAGFFLRLLLIPLTLYAMIRFLFLSLPAAVAGFAVFYCSVFIEGVVEALQSRSD